MPTPLARPVLLAVAVLVGAAGCGGDDAGGAATDGGGEAIEGVQVERIGDYVHALEDFDYPDPAPSGGDHGPYALTCGVYEGHVPEELVVHSMEHGAVWIALGPTSTAEDREAATDLAEGRKVVVSDVPDLAGPVELVAWGRRLPLDSVADPRAAAFVDASIDGPGAPEAGSSCQNLGEPPTPPALPTS